MARNLIVIGGGNLQIPLIQTALDMKLGVIVFDMSSDAPGMRIATVPVVMSTRDIDGCVREARNQARIRTIHGVITSGTDASRAVAAIANALNLPGIRYADAEAASNKVLMRNRLKLHGLPIPKFYSVWSLKEARDAMNDLGLPLVLKPADNMGARGVVKITAREGLQAAYLHSKKFSPTGEMILEEYMEGAELSVDALAWKDNFRITGIADRIIEGEPYFIERGHNMPSAMPEAIIEEASAVMIQAMKALGIHTGAGKGDLKVTKNGVMIGEVAARLSGGYMSSHTFPLHSGINLLRAAIQIALGDEPDSLKSERNRVVVERSIISRPGKLLSITGAEEASQIKGVHNIYITRKHGEVMQSPSSNLDKIGHVIASGNTLEEAEAAAENAIHKIEIIIDDAYAVNWGEVENRARILFGDSICRVCKVCDGTHCASGIPGMGGIGRMTTFIDNSKALEEIKIVPRYIRSNIEPDTTVELFGRKFEHPIMTAPVTGVSTNLNNAISEYDLANILMTAARDSGSIAWLGDGATPEKFKIILSAIEKSEGFSILICKPRNDINELINRFKQAEDRGVLGVGIDIDSVSLPTMKMKNIPAITWNPEQIRRLRESVSIPFILKGIMSVEDLRLAAECGVDYAVISNHGGRVMDDMPGTARVMKKLAAEAAGKIELLADGGIRSGQDVFKMMGLGAKAILIGRPVIIAAVGGNYSGVKYLLNRYKNELYQTMNLCGSETLADINRGYLMNLERSVL